MFPDHLKNLSFDYTYPPFVWSNPSIIQGAENAAGTKRWRGTHDSQPHETMLDELYAETRYKQPAKTIGFKDTFVFKDGVQADFTQLTHTEAAEANTLGNSQKFIDFRLLDSNGNPIKRYQGLANPKKPKSLPVGEKVKNMQIRNKVNQASTPEQENALKAAFTKASSAARRVYLTASASYKKNGLETIFDETMQKRAEARQKTFAPKTKMREAFRSQIDDAKAKKSASETLGSYFKKFKLAK